MTDFEKAMAAAKKLADKNGSMITEADLESFADSYKLEPDDMITLRAELDNAGVKINDPDLDNDDTGDDEGGEDFLFAALVVFFNIRIRDNNVCIRVLAVRDKALRAVQNVVIPFFYRTCLDTLGIRAGTGLR